MRLLAGFVVSAALAAAVAAAGPDPRAADQAQALMRSGRYEDAARRWEEALGPGASNKALKAGLTPMGRCYEETRNFQKALTAYQRALQLDEKNVDRVLDLARVYVLTDLDQEAVELYKHVLALDKRRYDARLALARLYAKTGRWEDARREGGLYAQWEPRDAAVQRLLAEVDEARGDLASAGRRREQLVAQEPTPQAYYELGRLWVRAGQWDSADAAFGRAEDLGMRTGAVYLHRGVARWLKGDALGADVLWRRALERHPGLGAAHFFLALSAREGKNPREAAAQARQARAGAKGELLKTLISDFQGEGKK